MKIRHCRKKSPFLLLCMIVLFAFSAAGCSSSESTSENASPETLYSSDHDIDMFIYEGTAVYKSGESEVLLAETEDALIPYLKYVEG